MSIDSPGAPGGEVLLYETPDGGVRVDVRLERETVWLTQQHMADLFGRERSVITKHVRNVFKEGELERPAVGANFAHTAEDGKTCQVEHYNLDAALAGRHCVTAKKSSPRSLEEDQRTRGVFAQQIPYVGRMRSQEALDGVGGAIAASNPHHLGRRIGEHAALVEIGILRRP